MSTQLTRSSNTWPLVGTSFSYVLLSVMITCARPARRVASTPRCFPSPADRDPQRHRTQLRLGDADEPPLEPGDAAPVDVQQGGAELGHHAALLEGLPFPILGEDLREQQYVRCILLRSVTVLLGRLDS